MASQAQKPNRRGFIKTAAATAFATQFGAQYIPAESFGKMEKPALAGIGAGGKGKSDLSQCKDAGFEIAALVDVVDATKIGKVTYKRLKSMGQVREAYPNAKFYTLYQQMLSDLGDKIDAVTVSTPDHHHFHASLLAMQLGKHVYCQKPLTHSIWEARILAQMADKLGLKTQMGNQAHANNHMRECVELIRAGIIGKVKEIHAWTNRPIWSQGFASAPAKDPAREGIDWEQWIGPAPWVDYSQKIAPFAWRGWWDYGTGALGDMACHIMDMGFWAMGLPAPQSVIASQKGATKLSPPINSKITWDFAPNEYSAADGFKYFWYDGYIDAKFDRDKWELVKNGNEYNHPSEEVLDGESFKEYGSVIVGDKGKLFFNRSKKRMVKPAELKQATPAPDPYIPRANGNNYAEWLDAITGKIDQSQSYFGQSGPLTEAILLGVIAQRNPDTKLKWNAEAMEIEGRPDLKKYIRREYRDGWQPKV